jgi:hypothetical protein
MTFAHFVFVFRGLTKGSSLALVFLLDVHFLSVTWRARANRIRLRRNLLEPTTPVSQSICPSLQ